jgi:hypothetical protein
VESCILCAYRIRLPLLKFIVAASIIIYGCVYMYFKGEDDYNMFYVAGQCMWKSYGNLEQYSKSGRDFPCLTNILHLTTQQHGGFFDASFPTDKVNGFGLVWFMLCCNFCLCFPVLPFALKSSSYLFQITLHNYTRW